MKGYGNFANRAFYLPATLLDSVGVTGENAKHGSYSASVLAEGKVSASTGGIVTPEVSALTAIEMGFAFDSQGIFAYNDPRKLGGYIGLEGGVNVGLDKKLNLQSYKAMDIDLTGSLGLAFLGSETADPSDLIGGIALETTQSYSAQAGRRGLTLELTDSYITDGKLNNDGDYGLFYTELSNVANQLLVDPDGEVFSKTHKASGFALSIFATTDKSPSVSVTEGATVSMKYNATKVNEIQYFGKTLYGAFKGYNSVYNWIINDENN